MLILISSLACKTNIYSQPYSPKIIPPPPFNTPAQTGGKPEIMAFDISPDVIQKHLNQKSTIHWNVVGANSTHISNIGYVPPIGTMVINPSSSVEITITASNPEGSVSQTRLLSVKP